MFNITITVVIRGNTKRYTNKRVRDEKSQDTKWLREKQHDEAFDEIKKILQHDHRMPISIREGIQFSLPSFPSYLFTRI